MKAILLAGLVSIWAVVASAHSPLMATTPANEATLAEIPTEIALIFKNNIRLTRVTSAHENGDPMKVEISSQTKFATDFLLPFNGVERGDYIIEWRGLGEDGHALNGSFVFTVK
ncbi:hypothetical protein BCF46_3496 [Litoreibacter meonggei]|uniref:CopC domain-containing protein n=1 Tax=Litoreibacter meonggei TaxID=1049199 RepID=A0A497VL30_9RHOB|nr:copper resistance CopC family protein [Litoreibacter meonggei]RLJ40925.1 hypothetical protein BCF46_3496 [Litoreibacter meonggei]